VTRETTLAGGRAFRDRVFFVNGSTCHIERVSGEATDLDTGVIVKTYITVYSGPCNVLQGSAGAGQVTVGEDALRLNSPTLALPVVGSEGLLTDDRVTILTSLNDTDLVGRQYFLTGESHGSAKTTRSLPMTEVFS
jgi:hypothetical protein